MSRVLRIGAVVVALACMFGLGWIIAKTGVGQAVPIESLTELERDFTERMQNVVLVGHFTIEGRETSGGSPERYEISRVAKVGDDRWRFDVHMVYGSVDATLPVVVPIVWAGDTPMVTITDFTIPTLGTFTARVFFYDDRYGGSWQHGQYGGLMYGQIEPLE
ncbi:MAG: hypothetical protein CL477_16225 [Acidobacteria bacterium]|nr:hypothetical protein [Acidobacteriota bacterium]MDP7338827.1 hypothetical protein [Vicinamibacterales bacterium]HJN45458.1 hypothetical protein [Vicinamibacterales bacterium]